MKIDFFTAGVDSLQLSLDHLMKGTDKDLRAAILLGFHGVTSLLKSVAVQNGVSVVAGGKSIDFPGLIGALKAQGWLSKGEGKSLHVLGGVRNGLEHDEPEYDRLQFQGALNGVLPIAERIAREHGDTDLFNWLTDEAWVVLMEIKSFFEQRADALDAVVEGVLVREIGWGKERSISNAQPGYCGQCGERGLPWLGTEPEEVRCRLCGEVNVVRSCNWCAGPVAIADDDEWPFYHEECLEIYLARD